MTEGAYDRMDASVCACCKLPTCEEKSSGIGYVCQPCQTHYEDGTSPYPGQDSGHNVPWEHEKLASAVKAAFAYRDRHPG